MGEPYQHRQETPITMWVVLWHWCTTSDGVDYRPERIVGSNDAQFSITDSMKETAAAQRNSYCRKQAI